MISLQQRKEAGEKLFNAAIKFKKHGRISLHDQSPRQVKGLTFSLLSAQDALQLSEFETTEKNLYLMSTNRSAYIARGEDRAKASGKPLKHLEENAPRGDERIPTPYGVLDRRLGISSKKTKCETCCQDISKCPGHFGYIRLALPVFHIGFFRSTITLLQCICKTCSTILIPNALRDQYLLLLRKHKDLVSRKAIFRAVVQFCRKTYICPHCTAYNGGVRRATTTNGHFKIVHIKYSPSHPDSKAKTAANSAFTRAEYQFLADATAKSLIGNAEFKNSYDNIQDVINPDRAHALFSRMSDADCELLDMRASISRPEDLIITHVLVPPVTIRPSISMQEGQSNVDDLTLRLSEIIHINNLLSRSLSWGYNNRQIAESWDFLQLQVALYMNSDLAGAGVSINTAKTVSRGICQRLKGKTGRFRGNLNGKRVDFSSRSVISPDPNLGIHQVGVPHKLAKILTYPEHITLYNLEKAKKLIENGPDIHPGANFLIQPDGVKLDLHWANKERIYQTLVGNGGWVIERHLADGDTVLFNRQPSLHRVSIMSHKVKVMPWKTFRFNECCCTPYNADFDGDEMNLHVPQTEEARAEADQLLNIVQNIISPRHGFPLIAATQDFITCAYLLSHKDTFFDKFHFMQLCASFSDASQRIDIPIPAILKPVQLWTGKQVFDAMLKEWTISFETETKSFKHTKFKDLALLHPDLYDDPTFEPNDGYILVRRSRLLTGVLDKSTLGSGSKIGVFTSLYRDVSPDACAKALLRLSKLSARFLGEYGFSIGIQDVAASPELSAQMEVTVKSHYEKCDTLIQGLQAGSITPQPGCTVAETVEGMISSELSQIRDENGNICLANLDPKNTPLIMATCGSKGSTINISQMIACVGQQTVGGSRIPNGFHGRTLPHFPLSQSRTPAAKGFVRNSFFSGLTPTEFWFHTMGGREGLVDTAVKTSETGYMQRRLMKSLEDLSCHYDLTVRNAEGNIVQFTYGDDGIDPISVEHNSLPINLENMLDNFVYNALDELKSDEKRVADALKNHNIITIPDRFKNSNQFYKAIKLKLHSLQELWLGRVVTLKEIEQICPDLAKEYEPLELFPYDSSDSKTYYSKKPKSKNVLGTGYFGNNCIPSVCRWISKIFQLFYKKTDLWEYFKTTHLEKFFEKVKTKFRKGRVDPGTAVGALAAQSIGEPGTQMTLKTFHFAGVASMNITLGVPRIKEIINASSNLSTPIITCELDTTADNKNVEVLARIVKGRIEITRLSQICLWMKEAYGPNGCWIEFKLDNELIQQLYLDISPKSITLAIRETSGIKGISSDRIVYNQNTDTYIIYATTGKNARKKKTQSEQNALVSIMELLSKLPNVVVAGISGVQRAILSKEAGRFQVMVDGTNFLPVLGTPGVDGYNTLSNHTKEIFKVLGIEAARQIIINEISMTMESHGMVVDSRHLALVADTMTYRGEVLGITRFGMVKMKSSVLMLASFEKTTDHLFDAAMHSRHDSITGVSERIILGSPVNLGTGICSLMFDLK